jgi:glycosyltransferase involved in cell wall biosynthesis
MLHFEPDIISMRNEHLSQEIVRALRCAHEVGLSQALSRQDIQTLEMHARELGWDAPIKIIATHKAAELVENGDFGTYEALFQLVQWCWNHADQSANAPLADLLKTIPLHRRVNEAVEATARYITATGLVKPTGPADRKIAFLISSLVRGAGTTNVINVLASDLAQRGWKVRVYSTALTGIDDPGMTAELIRNGVHFFQPPPRLSALERVIWTVKHLEDHPTGVLVDYSWPQDLASRLVFNLRLSHLQVFINHTCDVPTGDFDIRVGYSGDYRGHYQAERYVTLPPCGARSKDAGDVKALNRAELGMPSDAFCIGTFGRLTKCVDEEFLSAMRDILSRNPHVVWLLVGDRDTSVEARIRAELSDPSLIERVVFTGFMPDQSYFRLLKSIDLYCDTCRWTGGQTIADAMACGRPIVSFSPGKATALAPFCNNSTQMTSNLLPKGYPQARAGDVIDYVNLTQRFIDDPAFRQREGLRARQSVAVNSWENFIRQFEQIIEKELESRVSRNTRHPEP